MKKPTNKDMQCSLQWACFAIGVLFLTVIGYVAVRHPSNFGTYFASSRAVLRGDNPYAVYPETYRSHYPHLILADVNLNPPATLPLFAAMGHFSVSAFPHAWTMLSIACFLIGALLLWREMPEMQPYQILWLLVMSPTLDTLLSAQIYALLFLLAAVACVLGHRRHLCMAGVVLGILVAIKPTMIFFVPFLWLAGYGETALYTGAAFGALWVFIPFFYPGAYPQWLAALHGDMHWLAVTDIAPIAIARRHGVGWLGFASAFLIFTILLVWIWKCRPSLADTCGIAACAGILCSPLAWYPYILVAAPFFVAHQWTNLEIVAATLLIVPAPLAAQSGSTVYLVALALMLCGFSKSRDFRSDTLIPAPRLARS